MPPPGDFRAATPIPATGSSTVDDCEDEEAWVWRQIKAEARRDAEAEPALASFLYSTILSHASFERSLAFHLGNKLCCSTLLATLLYDLFLSVFASDPSICSAAICDLRAVRFRDPACISFSNCLLNFKGFLACQTHRVAHRLWNQQRRPLALALHSRVSEVFAIDIHPAAKIGRGLMFDHATGLVIGETAVIGNNVSLLHHVTLGGTGKATGDRHPKIGDGVLIGASATILGNVKIGEGAKIGAGSVVLIDVPPRTTAVGNPARLVGGKDKPSQNEENTCKDINIINQDPEYKGQKQDVNIVDQDSLSKNQRRGGKKKKKNKRRKSGTGPNVTNIDRFVQNACRQLREKKSYMLYTAVGCLGISALTDLVNEVNVIQECGGQMTADGRRHRNGGGILWNIIKARDPNAFKEITKKAREFEKQFRPQNVRQVPVEKKESSELASEERVASVSDGSEVKTLIQTQNEQSNGEEAKRAPVHDRIRVPVSYADLVEGPEDHTSII